MNLKIGTHTYRKTCAQKSHPEKKSSILAIIETQGQFGNTWLIFRIPRRLYCINRNIISWEADIYVYMYIYIIFPDWSLISKEVRLNLHRICFLIIASFFCVFRFQSYFSCLRRRHVDANIKNKRKKNENENNGEGAWQKVKVGIF